MDLPKGTVFIQIEDWREIENKLAEYEVIKEKQLNFEEMNNDAKHIMLNSIGKAFLGEDVKVISSQSGVNGGYSIILQYLPRL